jgi:hypothetical protein
VVFSDLRRKNRITRESLGDDKEEAERLIRYLKQTGLFLTYDQKIKKKRKNES